ncbi:MAG: hypothetical protein R3E68_02830 [Burkholderiaceae bacterium]
MRFLLFAVGAMAVTSAWPFEYWIGPPRLSDHIFRSANEALRSAQQCRNSANSFQADLDRAREAYFTSQGSKRISTGEEFGRRLFAKDLVLAAMPIADGFSAQSDARSQLLAAIAGGKEIDGGIRSSARPAFNTWISAMCRAMHPPESEQRGKRPLRGPRHVLTVVASLTPERFYQMGATDEVAAAQKAGAMRLRCEYGPSFDKDGDEEFGRYDLWKDQLPPSIERLLAFNELIGHVAVSACPRNETPVRQMLANRPNSSLELRNEANIA